MMKNVHNLLLLGMGIMLSASMAAQKPAKFGHIDSQKLLMSMPESDSAQIKLKRIEQDYQNTIESLQVELNKKFADYQQNATNWSPLIRTTKESELNDLNERIQNFQQQAQLDYERQRVDIFRPIQEKAKQAVDQVAEENGFTYIFDVGPGVGAIVYSSPETHDILPMVRKKLNLK